MAQTLTRTDTGQAHQPTPEVTVVEPKADKKPLPWYAIVPAPGITTWRHRDAYERMAQRSR